MQPSKPAFWQQLDAWIFKVERAVVVAAVAIMTAVVFLAVVWDRIAAPKGKLQVMLEHALKNTDVWVGYLAFGIQYVAWVALCMFAVCTGRPRRNRVKHVWFGFIIATACVLVAHGMVALLPGGIVFSQKLALSLFMWVALLGSSMAAHTRRHIFLQAAQRIIAPKKTRLHAALGMFLAAGFTCFLMVVGTGYTIERLSTWVESDMQIGNLESIPIPVWLITLAFPVGFGLTMSRFIGQGIGILRGTLPALPQHDDITVATSMQQGDVA